MKPGAECDSIKKLVEKTNTRSSFMGLVEVSTHDLLVASTRVKESFVQDWLTNNFSRSPGKRHNCPPVESSLLVLSVELMERGQSERFNCIPC